MSIGPVGLPEDVESLRALALRQQAQLEQLEERERRLEEQTARLRRQEEQLTEQSERIEFLEEYIRLLKHQRFGRSSEKSSTSQIGLFNEAECAADASDTEAAEADETIAVPAHTRRKRGRRPIPAEIPRVEILHDLSEDEKVCAQDGHRLQEIGRETSEQLEIVPATIQVLRHVRPKYACPHCKSGVKIAPLPPQPIPKSLAAPGLLAHIAISKYADGLPLYRQEKMLQRLGLDLPRATLAHWMIRSAELAQPLLNLMREEMVAGDLIGADETRFQVLKEPGKAATSLSYLWVWRGGSEDHPLLLYDYAPSRGGEVPKRLLEGFRGYLQVDGYEGYNEVCEANGLVRVGCFAHARRKFDEALKAQGKGKKTGKKRSAKVTKARQGLDLIRELYRIEREIAGQPPDERYRVRQECAKPQLEKIRQWLDASLGSVPPQSLTGKALAYLDRQWDRLVRYLDDGRLRIDNNLVENAIRPFVVGRKAWLFSDTVRGAQASANLYSLVETAKVNGIEPYAYLRHVFTEIPKATTLEHIEALLPHCIDPAQIKRNVNR
jgi:transposase